MTRVPVLHSTLARLAPSLVFAIASILFASFPAGAQSVRLSTFDVELPGENIALVKTADIDSDGDADAVVVINPEIFWLEGDGLGGFVATHPVASSPAFISDLDLGDTDGDLDPEVVWINFNSPTIYVAENFGGFFSGAPTAIEIGNTGIAISLRLGDVTGDGLGDVVGCFTGGVFLVPSSGGGFGSAQALQFGPTPRGVAIADIGGLPTADVVITGVGQGRAFLDGSLVGGSLFPIPTQTQGPELAELTGDGLVDLLIPEAVLPGDGAGGFGAAVAIAPSPDAARCLAVMSDVDGFSDVVIPAASTAGGDSMRIHRRDATGFTGESYVIAVANVSRDFAAADLDADGFDELLLPSVTGVAVLRPRSTGEYRAPTGFDAQRIGLTVVFADVTDDGIADLLSSHSGSSPEPTAVAIHPGLGGGDYGPPIYIPTVIAQDLAVGDLDGNGRTDIVVASTGSPLVHLMQDLNGNFAPLSVPTQGVSPWRVAVADFTGDGLPDVFAGFIGSEELWMYPSDGSPFPYATGFVPNELIAKHIGGSPLPDLLVARDDGSVMVEISLGGGTFSSQAPVVTSGAPVDIALGDGNGDGIDDLFTAEGSNTIAMYPGTGGGQFGPASAPATAPFAVGDLDAGDLDGDGLADVAVGNPLAFTTPTILTFVSDGLGGFAAAESHNVRLAPKDIVIADVDLDGVRDILMVDPISVSLVRNETLDPPPDRRGDCNDDASIDLADPIHALRVLFAGSVATCPDACDVDDSGTLDVADPIGMLMALFQGGPALGGSSGCRPDLSADNLSPCAGSAGCPTP